MLSVHFKVAPFRGQIKLKLNTQIGPFYRFNSNFLGASQLFANGSHP